MLLIFDVDGTLYDESAVKEARHEAVHSFVKESLGLSTEEADRMRDEVVSRMPVERSNTSAYIFEAMGFPRQKFFELLDSMPMDGLVIPYPGCRETIEQLARAHTLVAYSNTPLASVSATLDILDISQYIKRIYSSQELDFSKPSKDALLIILEDQGFTAGQAVMIGNSPDKDIAPARELGLSTILVDPDRRYGKGAADEVVSDLGELLTSRMIH